VEVLGLVSLTSGTCPHKVLHKTPHVGEVEVAAESVQCALDALVATIVDSRHDFLQEWRGRRYVQAPVVEDHVISHRPWCSTHAGVDIVVDGD